ncbi:hypothetical protein UPYG_G00193830 [Umbra pygmaea]|uniref:Galectin n=1 Tax=Umbra pygmaea TaxID=75934 RepID=A0ABD0WGP2_UMBPY
MIVAPPGYQPVYNPSIPHVRPIYGGLKSGMSIYVQGMIPQNITLFILNLKCGEAEGSDIAFTFNPRFDGVDKVVFNSRQDGKWQEEKTECTPFKKNNAFELVIIVNQEEYQVLVNGKEFYKFKHSIPVEKVCALQIGGDVSIQTINVIGGGYPGGIQPTIPGPVYNAAMPFSGKIPGGMSFNRTIIIRGKVPLKANRFLVSLLVGGTKDIAFCFNPRIQERVVVRNSFFAGAWGQEERQVSLYPFQEGQYFDVTIRCGNQRYKVFVNGQHICDYNHRYANLSQIDTLELTEDLEVSYVYYTFPLNMYM